MKKISCQGWHVGMKSLRFARLLHEELGIGLSEAWDLKTRVLNNERVMLAVPETLALLILEKIRNLGVKCQLENELGTSQRPDCQPGAGPPEKAKESYIWTKFPTVLLL